MAETSILRSKATSGYVRNSPQAGNNSQIRGVLPTVQVAMTAGGPEIQNPQVAQPAQARSNTIGKQARHNAGGLPMVQVKMTQAGPQVLSGAPDQGVKPRWSPQGPQRAQVVAPPPPAPVAVDVLSDDQLLLCRHLVTAYLTSGKEESPENIALAESTIAAIDAAMLAMTAQQALAMEAAEAAQEPAQPQRTAPVQHPRMIVTPGKVIANQRSSQINAAAAPRRVPRPEREVAPTATAATRPVQAQAAPPMPIPPGGFIDVPTTDQTTPTDDE